MITDFSMYKIVNNNLKKAFDIFIIGYLGLIGAFAVSYSFVSVFSSLIAAGVVFLTSTVIFFLFKKEMLCGYINAFLNCIGMGLIIGACYIFMEQKLSIIVVLIVIIAMFLYQMVITMLMIKSQRKDLVCIINYIVLISLAITFFAAWIIYDTVSYSLCLFFVIINLFVNMSNLLIIKEKGRFNTMIFLGYSGAFCVIMFIVLAIISEGDALDLGDIDISGTKRDQKVNNIIG